MRFQEYKESLLSKSVLQEIDVAGSFDFYSTIVSFESLNSRHMVEFESCLKDDSVQNFFSAKSYEILSKIVPLATHEYTHFIDATCTVWGARYLYLMADAYASHPSFGGVESKFQAAKTFHDFVRSIRLPKYFTHIDKHVSNQTPWHQDITSGLRYNYDGTLSDRPVLFARFYNSNGHGLARSPMSTVSLLEASAVSQEIQSYMSLVSDLNEEDTIFANRSINLRFLSEIYNKELTEYSVCVHVLANQMGCKDILRSFVVCGAICRIILNATKSFFESAINSNSIEKILGLTKGGSEYDRFHKGLEFEDYGFLFYLFVSALPKNTLDSQMFFRKGIKEGFKNIGYSYARWNKERTEYIDCYYSDILSMNVPLVSLRQIVEASTQNLKQFNPLKGRIDLSKMHLPPALLGDGTCATILGREDNKLKSFDVEACFNEMGIGESWVSRFSEACLA